MRSAKKICGLFIAAILLTVTALTTFAPAQSIPIFDLSEEIEYNYEINISFTRESNFESSSEQFSENQNARMEGSLTLFETVSVVENFEDEYARIACRFDSLSGRIESVSDGTPSAIEIFSERDHVLIYRNDSLISEYTPQGGSNRAAYDFYERLLFLGEDIIMLVYPNGEIINITENKNLWNLSRDLLGMPGGGFLEIVFPEGQSQWEGALEISRLGDFDLQKSPEPLIIEYNLGSNLNNLEFEGDLFLRQFNSEATVSELDDKLTLILDNYQIKKSGSASFSPSAGTLEKMDYSISRIGNVTLKGRDSEDYSIRMRIDAQSKVVYTLIK
ncbi:MAG: hypothetical protein GF310_01370 [candidate division Zixibacteria bacterium]|nr:hypothetical protein [candidate division Zixibacteria bacterium]